MTHSPYHLRIVNLFLINRIVQKYIIHIIQRSMRLSCLKSNQFIIEQLKFKLLVTIGIPILMSSSPTVLVKFTQFLIKVSGIIWKEEIFDYKSVIPKLNLIFLQTENLFTIHESSWSYSSKNQMNLKSLLFHQCQQISVIFSIFLIKISASSW